MTFSELPKDLKNLICDFAYECSWQRAQKDIETCIEINKMEIHSQFMLDHVYSMRYDRILTTPLLKFEPIVNYMGRWRDLFDWRAVHELLWRLDFRRKYVKFVYSRVQWHEMFRVDWKHIALFDEFFRVLIYTRVDCFKPIWKACALECLKQTGMHPFYNLFNSLF